MGMDTETKEKPETDPVILAQETLAEATLLLRAKDDAKKAQAALKIADAMIELLKVLKASADAEIKSGNAGAKVNNLLAFVRKPCEHNLAALNVIKAQQKGPGIVVSREMPKDNPLKLVK